jgi:hypothetical protein
MPGLSCCLVGALIHNAYARAFFDTYLLGQTSPLLAGPAPDYQEVIIEKR